VYTVLRIDKFRSLTALAVHQPARWQNWNSGQRPVSRRTEYIVLLKGGGGMSC